jgi:tetratricopeptide (TPR) repeat protein
VFLTVLFLIATILPARGAGAQASAGANANAVAVQHAPDRAAVLGLARTHYEKASPQIEPDLLPEFARLVDWPVRFDGSGVNPGKASDFTNSVAFLVGYTDARNFYLACAAASFTLDPANATGAGNLGAAIVSYGEDAVGAALVGAAPDGAQTDGQLKPYRDDAIAMYLYALSLGRAPGPVLGGGAVTLLVNLGNLYLDTGVPENARVEFEKALQIQPNSWPAHQGMAAYYLAVGRRDLAEKELKKRECWPASIRKVAETADKTDEKAAPPVAESDSEADMEAKLAQLAKVEPVTTADFIEELDQSEANKLRYFVRNLALETTYTAPSIKDFMQYGSLEAFCQPHARAAFEQWQMKFKSQTLIPLAVKQATMQVEYLKTLGLEVEGLDMADVAKHPDKYSHGKQPKVKVKGLDEFKAKMQAMAQQMKNGAAKGQVGQTGGLAPLDAAVHTATTILTVNPYNYANPADVFVQKFNMVLLNRKMLGYKLYLKTVLKRFGADLDDLHGRAQREVINLQLDRDAAVEKVENDAAAAHQPVNLLTLHRVHETYDPQINQVTSQSWLKATEMANAEYLRRLKPNLEAMYADCMRHIMLISDPDVRTAQENDLVTSLLVFVNETMTDVMKAYAGKYIEPWDCGCNIEELEKARVKEQQEYLDELAKAQQAANTARKDLKEGVIPETSALYKKIDSYSAVFKVLCVEGKIGTLKSSLKFVVAEKTPTGEKAGGSLEIGRDHQRQTTTVAAGVEASQTAGGDRASVTGKVWANTVLTVDDEWRVRDWDIAAGASLTGSVGVGQVGGNSVNLEGSAAFETSVNHGSSLSGSVALVAKASGDSPFSVLDALPVDMSLSSGDASHGLKPPPVKFPVWNGQYKF